MSERSERSGFEIAIVAALPEEVRSLVRQHRLQRAGSGRTWRGVIAGVLVRVVCTGMGRLGARQGVVGLLEANPPSAFVFVGIAAAASEHLQVGDLVVASRVSSTEPGAPHIEVPESPWFERSTAVATARVATLLSVPRILSTAVEKRQVAQLYASDGETLVVDMESYAWATAARDSGVPFAVICAVSDTAAEDLPLDLNPALRDDGSLSRARAVVCALRRPRCIPDLLRLRARVNLCSHRLAAAVASILE